MSPPKCWLGRQLILLLVRSNDGPENDYYHFSGNRFCLMCRKKTGNNSAFALMIDRSIGQLVRLPLISLSLFTRQWQGLNCKCNVPTSTIVSLFLFWFSSSPTTTNAQSRNRRLSLPSPFSIFFFFSFLTVCLHTTNSPQTCLSRGRPVDRYV